MITMGTSAKVVAKYSLGNSLEAGDELQSDESCI